jgi:hypothetical protein
MALTWPQGQKKEKKQTYQHVRLTCNMRLKPPSLLFDLNGVTHELIVPQTNNININNLAPNNKPRNAQISHHWPQDVLGLSLTFRGWMCSSTFYIGLIFFYVLFIPSSCPLKAQLHLGWFLLVTFFPFDQILFVSMPNHLLH